MPGKTRRASAVQTKALRFDKSVAPIVPYSNAGLTMRRTLLAATIFVVAFSQHANAGLWRDVKHNLAGLGLPIEEEIPIEQPTNIPAPMPLPISPVPAVAYVQWLAPQLKSGMAIYNRPCTIQTGYGPRVVKCPVGLMVLDAPATPTLQGSYPLQPTAIETVGTVRQPRRHDRAHALPARHIALEHR
jgi:hypothetical protein